MADIHHLLRISAPRTQVYAALTEAEHVRCWWTPETDLDRQADGEGVFRFADAAVLTRIRIATLDAPVRVVWKVVESNAPGNWIGTEIAFVLSEDGAGTIIRFTHRDFPEADDGFARVSTGWAHYLTNLKRYLDNGESTADSKPRAITDGETVLACVDLPSAPDRVFRALNTAEVEFWWGTPETYHMTDWRADLRVGGRWSFNVRHGEQVNPASGVYSLVDAPHRISFSRVYDWPHPTLGGVETRVFYSCTPIREGTHLIVRHDGFGGRIDAAYEHAAGWERTLAWLDRYLRHDAHEGRRTVAS